MARPSRYPHELQGRAVRMVIESRAEDESEYAAIKSVSAKLGITSPESLRKWLRRANEILKSASAFFASMSK